MSINRAAFINKSTFMALLGLICLSVNMIDAAPSAMDFAKMFGLVYNTKYTGAFIEDNK